MLHYFTYMWNLKNKINEPAEEKQTCRCRKHFYGLQMGGELGKIGNEGEGIKYKMIVTEQSWESTAIPP